MSSDATGTTANGVLALAARDGEVLEPSGRWAGIPAAAGTGVRVCAPPPSAPRLVACWAFDVVRNAFTWADDVFGTAGTEGLERPTLDALLRERVHPDDIQVVLDAFFAALEGECPHQVRYRMRFPDGSDREILEQGRIVRDERGRARKLLATCHDVTGLNGNAAALLAASQTRLHALEGGAIEGVAVHRAGIPLYVSPRLAELLGYAGPEALVCAGRLAMLIVPEDAPAGHDCERALLHAQQRACHHEFRTTRADGTVFWGETRRRVVDWDGLRAVQTSVVDITARRELAGRLDEARQMEAVASLAGGLTHEFNNVLQIISGHATLLRNGAGLDEAQARRAAGIQQAAGRGSRLVRKLLAVGRRQELARAPVDVNALIGDVLNLLAPGEAGRAPMRFAPGHAVAPALGDAEAIEQIVINLYANARDAMEEGGRAQVRTANARFFETTLRNYPWATPGRYVEITVSDTGPGMNADTVSRIFRPFYSTKPAERGSGLGLCVVQSLVQQQGGFIRVDSEPGRGTAFHIYLPAADALAPATAPGAADEAPAAREAMPTVLVLEHDPAVAELIGHVMDKAGCRLLEAPDEAGALRLFAGHAARVDMVLLDAAQPGAKVEALYRALRERRPAVPVVFLTGGEPEEATAALIRREAQPLLRKPFGLQELLGTVQELLPAQRPG